jgi:hypothetical protein
MNKGEDYVQKNYMVNYIDKYTYLCYILNGYRVRYIYLG